MEGANSYLPEFTKDYNRRFAKALLLEANMHRVLSPHMVLDEILCFKTLRTVSNSLTFQHNRQLYLLNDTIQARALRRKQVSLYEYPESYIKVFHQNQEFEYRMIYDRVNQVPQGEIVTDNRYLTEALEYAKKRQQELPPKKRAKSAPARTHLAEDCIAGNERNEYLAEVLEYAKQRQNELLLTKKRSKSIASKVDVKCAA